MSRKRNAAITHPQSFYDRLGGIAQRLGTTPDALLGVMKIESGLNPSAVNRGTNATGLIQFMPKTAKSVGTSVESLKKMSATDQLAFVEKYYTSIGMRNRMNTVHDAYLATFYPRAVGKPDHYEFPKEVVKANRGIDLNKDGRINVGEVKQFVDQRLGIKTNPYPALKMNDQAMVMGNNYAFTGRDNTSVVNNSPTVPGVFVATKGLRPEAVVELGMNPRLGGDAGWVMQNILAPKGKAKGMLPKAENGLMRLSDDERKGTRTTTLPETEIKSVSPRQQAYNDSLLLYNLGLTNEKNQAVIFSNAYKRAGAGRQTFTMRQVMEDEKIRNLVESYGYKVNEKPLIKGEFGLVNFLGQDDPPGKITPNGLPFSFIKNENRLPINRPKLSVQAVEMKKKREDEYYQKEGLVSGYDWRNVYPEPVAQRQGYFDNPIIKSALIQYRAMIENGINKHAHDDITVPRGKGITPNIPTGLRSPMSASCRRKARNDSHKIK